MPVIDALGFGIVIGIGMQVPKLLIEIVQALFEINAQRKWRRVVAETLTKTQEIDPPSGRVS